MTSGPRARCLFGSLLAAAALPAVAQGGLSAAQTEWLWPQIQARITLQTAAPSPLATTPIGPFATQARGADGAGRVVQGAGVLGDYFLYARPAFGSLRATSGLLLGHAGGAPTGGLALAPRVAVGLLEGGGGAEPALAQTYLGLGYDSPPLWGGLAITADLGFAASRWGGVGRALAGQHGWDAAVRELRLSPHLQLGLRYAF